MQYRSIPGCLWHYQNISSLLLWLQYSDLPGHFKMISLVLLFPYKVDTNKCGTALLASRVAKRDERWTMFKM